MTATRLRAETALFFGAITTVIFLIFGKAWLGDLENANGVVSAFLFAWIFGAMLWCSFGVVRHADCLAVKLGEPYGTLILTLSVISIEVIVISAVMLTGKDNPTLGRDMMFSVLMIVLNGLVGLSLIVGAWRHLEQSYNLQGSITYLTVLAPLALLGLVLPGLTKTTEGGTLSIPQEIFLLVTTIALYVVFLAVQTLRHRGYFVHEVSGDNSEHDHGDLDVRSVPFHSVMIVLYLLPIVLLSKKLALMVDFGLTVVGAPAALGGMLVAILVLSPEGMAAIQSAANDKLQRSINVCLGSALATIGLTIPAVLGIGLALGTPIVLGLDPANALLLGLTILVTMLTLGTGRTNVMQGVVHLILFAYYIMLVFD